MLYSGILGQKGWGPQSPCILSVCFVFRKRPHPPLFHLKRNAARLQGRLSPEQLWPLFSVGLDESVCVSLSRPLKRSRLPLNARTLPCTGIGWVSRVGRSVKNSDNRARQTMSLVCHFLFKVIKSTKYLIVFPVSRPPLFSYYFIVCYTFQATWVARA